MKTYGRLGCSYVIQTLESSGSNKNAHLETASQNQNSLQVGRPSAPNANTTLVRP